MFVSNPKDIFDHGLNCHCHTNCEEMCKFSRLADYIHITVISHWSLVHLLL